MSVGAVSRPRNSAPNTQLVHYDVAFKKYTNKIFYQHTLEENESHKKTISPLIQH